MMTKLTTSRTTSIQEGCMLVTSRTTPIQDGYTQQLVTSRTNSPLHGHRDSFLRTAELSSAAVTALSVSLLLWYVRPTSNNLAIECSAPNDSSNHSSGPVGRYTSGQRWTITNSRTVVAGITSPSVLSVCFPVCTPLLPLWCLCKTIKRLTSEQTNRRAQTRPITPPGGMCEPWCAM